MNNWVEINEQALAQNYAALTAAAGPETEILAVVKANAYGHGAERCALVLARAGARWLGVTNPAEGVRVRQTLAEHGLHPEILVMCGTLPAPSGEPDAHLLAFHSLTPVVWTVPQLDALPPGLRVHVEIDTGMGRQGVLPAALPALLRAAGLRALIVDGLFTHFCSSEDAASALTQRQQTLFAQAVAAAAALGLAPTWLHAGNSSTLDNPANPDPANPARPDAWLPTLARTIGARAMIRPGLALYGHCLPIAPAPASIAAYPTDPSILASTAAPATPHLRPALQPVLTWKARILSIRTLAPGETVGYNATFTAPTPMRIATLPVGYADGLRRELSSTASAGWTILHGQRAPILGRISMNLTVVDVTHIPLATPGDEAILLGPGITAEDHARLAHTIPYEILCGIHPCE